ncbi:hypothetical protein HWV62_10044 [Athelia sp. TMB]|nr:hypothetical protein HWV62_10044 [Athelia sp. TMB]
MLPVTGLCQFAPNISPWKDPRKWRAANIVHIQSVLQETGSDQPLKEYLAVKSRMMVYPRLVAYVSTYLTATKKTDFNNDKLQKWTTLDDMAVTARQQTIKEDLQTSFNHISEVDPNLHTNDTFEKLLRLDVIDLSAQLTILLMDADRYETFIKCQADSAQRLLDLLQARLDYHIEPTFKPRHIRAIVKLSNLSGMYPGSLELEEIPLEGQPSSGGTFGDVFKSQTAERAIAIKALRTFKRDDPKKILKVRPQLPHLSRQIEGLSQRFAKEGVIWRQLSHPNVLPLYGLFVFNESRLCLVSPWMNHGSLDEYLLSQKPSVSDRALLALDVAEGLAYLHSQTVVHADLKGMNVLVSQSCRACLADFGLSLAKGNGSIQSTGTSMGARGTFNWMAPEFFQGVVAKNVRHMPIRATQESDIYSFAMVWYEIFAGSIPFPDNSEYEVTVLVYSGRRPERPANLHSQADGLTDCIWEIIVTCWDPLPAKRLKVDEAAQRLRGLSGFPKDDRPLDDHGMPPSLRTKYDQALDPFVILEPIIEQVDRREVAGHGVSLPSAEPVASPSDLAGNPRTSLTGSPIVSVTLSGGDGLLEAPLTSLSVSPSSAGLSLLETSGFRASQNVGLLSADQGEIEISKKDWQEWKDATLLNGYPRSE